MNPRNLKLHKPLYESQEQKIKRLILESLTDDVKDFIVKKFMDSKFATEVTKDITNNLLQKLDIKVEFKD